MMHFLADENFNYAIVLGLKRRVPSVQIVRVQEVGLGGKRDELVFDYAVTHQLLLLSHDVNTMRALYYRRIVAGMAVPGLFLIEALEPIGKVIASLETIVEASTQEEWLGKIEYIPL